MRRVPIYTRLTRRYVDEYRHLDAAEYVGTVKLLAGRQILEPQDFDDGGSRRYRVVAPRELASTDLSDAIADTFSHYGCSHEYDCCGCASHSASVRRVSRREYTMTIHTSYNY